eukprot:m.309608 g.309608  ORF g.309608 m.309608 type:complete len:1260 (+) comp47090_c0_seq1:159-3938(+)
MQEEEKAILRYHREALTEDLEFDKVRDALVSRGVIDDDDEERIDQEKSRRDKARELLRIIPRRGSSAYGKFLESIEEPYKHLHQLLKRRLEEEEESDDVAEKRVRQVLLEGQVPPRPAVFAARPAEITKLRETLFSLKETDGWVVLHGMGGSGKTSLAAEALRDPKLLRQCFPSGVFWLTVGQMADERGQVDQSKLLMKMNNLCSRLDEEGTRSTSSNVEDAHNRLHNIFTHQYPRSLLILDDVWSPVVARAFAIRACTLVTTRDRTVADQVRASRREYVSLDAGFTAHQAKTVLSGWTGMSIENLPKEADEIIKESGSSPLAVSMIGALLQKDPSQKRWLYYLKNLRDRKLSRIRRPSEYEYDNLDASIGISFDALDDKQQKHYLMLSVFEDDAVFTSRVLGILWEVDSMEVEEEYMKEFVDKSLVKRVGVSESDYVLYTIHDLQLDYLKAMAAGDLIGYHRLLVERYKSACDGDFAVVEKDGYVHAHLMMHMLRAGMREEAAALLGSLEWTVAKLKACGPAECLSDYLRYGSTCGVKKASHSLNDSKPVTTQRSSSRQAVTLADFQHFISMNAHFFFYSDSFPDVIQLALSEPTDSDVYQQALAMAKANQDPNNLFIDWTNKREIGEWHLMTQKVTDDPVRYATFSPDSKTSYFLTCSDNFSVLIWATGSGKVASIFEGHQDIVHCARFSSDGQKVVSCSADGTAKVWDSLKGTLVTEFSNDDDENAIFSCSFSPNDKFVVSSSEDGTVKVWDSSTGSLKFTCDPPHESCVVACAFSSNNKRIASCSEDCTLKLWNAVDGSLIATFTGHEATVNDCAFSPNGTTLVSASNDYTVRIWDELEKETPVQKTLKKKTNQECCYPMLCCAYSAKLIAAGGADSNIEIWEASGYSHLFTLSGHTGWVHSCNFSKGGDRLVSSSDDGNVKIWDMTRNVDKKRTDSNPHYSRRHDVRFQSSDGSVGTLVAMDTQSNKLKVWSKDGEWELPENVKSWCLGGPNDSVAVGYISGRVEVFKNGDKVKALESHSDKIRHCFFSPDGDHLVTCSDDKTHKLWDVSNGSLVFFVEADTKGANRPCCFFNKSLQVVSATYTGNIIIWSQSEKSIKAHNDLVTSVAVSSDDEKIVSVSVDKGVKVWKHNGDQLYEFPPQKDVVRSCVFSPLGKLLATGSDDGNIKVWNVESGQQQACCSGHEGWIVAICFSSDGSKFVSIDKNSIRWWSKAGQFLQVYHLKGQFPKAIHAADDFSAFFTVDDSGLSYHLRQV